MTQTIALRHSLRWILDKSGKPRLQKERDLYCQRESLQFQFVT